MPIDPLPFFYIADRDRVRGEMLRAVLFAAAWGAAAGDVLPLDDARPALSSGGAAVDWTSGGGAFLVASTPILRVNYRGVFTDSGTLRDLAALGWQRYPCNASAWGLCRADFGTAFPAAPRATDAPAVMPADLQGLGCANAAAVLLTDLPVYDLSACDVLDEGWDVLYSGRTLYLARNPVSQWAYWTLIAGAVLLVRGLAQNVQAHKEVVTTVSQALPLLASGVCIVVVARDGGSPYATKEDYVFYVATVFYSICYFLYHVAFAVYEHVRGARGVVCPPIFNLAGGVLQLIVSRLYTGAESPYSPVVLLILSTRALTKLSSPSAAHALTALLDACYVALACEVGFLPDASYLSALFAVACLVSQIYFEQVDA
jgi:hypothetical protein